MAIVVKTVSDSREAQKDLQKLREGVQQIQNTAAQTSASFSNMAKVIGGAFAGLAVGKALVQQSDEFTRYRSKLQVATKSQEEFNLAFRELQSIAISTRSSLDATASLYSRIALSTQKMGVSQGTTLSIVESVNKALKVSGASAAEAAGAMQQLAQGIGSNRLSGEELRSVLENAPYLALELAEGLGKSVGELKKLGEEGFLTADKVLNALIKRAGAIEERFKKVGVTFEQAFSNLGLSVRILFDEIANSIFKSRGGIATFIDDIAKKIFSFAKNFQFYFLSIRTEVLLFALSFADIFSSVGEYIDRLGQKALDFAHSLLDEWEPSLKAASTYVASWATIAAGLVVSLYQKIKQQMQGLSIQDLGAGLYRTFESIVNSIVSLFTRIKESIPKINVMDYFPNLTPALEMVKGWVKTVERWFWWLYDKVIGRSWIPDLINGITDWMKKLLQAPLEYVKKFASSSSAIFGRMKFASVFLAGIALVNKYKSALLGLLAVLGAVGAGFLYFKQRAEKGVNINVDENKSSKTTDVLTGILEQTKKTASNLTKSLTEGFSKSKIGKAIIDKYASTKEAANQSLPIRTLKQVFGMRDTTPGEVFGVPIDTQTNVGRGVHRSKENRPFGHDLLSALPTNWQLPAIAAVTAVVSLGIIKAFQAGPVRMALLSLWTTVTAVAAVQNVSDAEIKRTTSNMAYGFLKLVKDGLTAIMSGLNVIKDPVGFLSILAKTAVLFAAGRDALLAAGKYLVTLPTTMTMASRQATMVVTSRLAAEKAEKVTTKLLRGLSNVSDNLRTDLNRQTTLLAQSTDQRGKLIGDKRAEGAIKRGDTAAFGRGSQAETLLKQAVVTAGALKTAQSNLENPSRAFPKEFEAATKLRAAADQAKLAWTEAKTKFSTGVVNLGAGIGGTIGGVSGFQFGVDFAESLGKQATQWQKIGIIIASSFVGQAAGAFAGIVLATLVNGALRIGTIIGGGILLFLVKPIVLLVGAIAAVIAMLANRKTFDPIFLQFEKVFKDGVDLFTKMIEEKLWPWAKQAGITFAESALDYFKTKGKETLSFLKQDVSTAGTQIKEMFTEGKPPPIPYYIQLPMKALYAAGVLIKDAAVILADVSANLLAATAEKLFPQKKATGGFIRGPGGPKDDKIPALLSNGEFVVNAESARENYSLLEAINSGRKVRRFQSGGAASGPIKLEPEAKNSFLELIERLKEVFAPLINGIKQLFGNMKFPSFFGGDDKGNKPSGGLGDPFKDDPSTTISRALSNLKFESKDTKETTASTEIVRYLKESGFSGIKPEEVAKFGKEGTNQIIDALDKIARLRAEGSKFAEGTFGRRQTDNLIQEWQNFLAGTLSGLKNKGVIKDVKGPPEEIDPKDAITLSDTFNFITTAFPELELSLEEFKRASDSFRNKLAKSAYEIVKETSDIDNIFVGRKDGSKIQSKDVQDKYKKIEEKRQAGVKEFLPQIDQVRSPLKALSVKFRKANLNISQEMFNMLKEADIERLTKIGNFIETSYLRLELPNDGLTPDERERLQRAIVNQMLEAGKIVGDAIKTGTERFAYVSAELSEFGVTLDKNLFSSLRDFQQDYIMNTISVLRGYKGIRDSTLDEETRRQAQSMIDSATESLRRGLARANPEVSRAAGVEFGKGVQDTFFTSVSDFLKGQKEEGKSYISTMFSSFLDKFTNQVIDAFVRGLTVGLSPEPVMKAVEGLGKGIFDLGANVLGGSKKELRGEVIPTSAKALSDTNSLIPSLDEAIEGLTKPLDFDFAAIEKTLGDNLLKGFESIDFASIFSNFDFGNLVEGVTSLIKAFGFFAEGGYISGPGTGTSDSIPAMLSNGEYVINAKATKTHFKLLDAINSGKISKFAEGGLVSTGLAEIPSIGSMPMATSTSSSNQVFNINITGDISRQTKAEIYQMLPQIASGVNSVNRERGYRG